LIFQIGPNFIETASNLALNILEKHHRRSAFSDESEDVWPEVSRIFCPFSFSVGCAERLTRIASREEIDWNKSVCFQLGIRQLLYIGIAWHIRPVLFEDRLRIGFAFTEGDSLHAPRGFQPKTESSNSAAQVQVAQTVLFHP
jgi:hypothetical protein